jgi:hypothetical protein
MHGPKNSNPSFKQGCQISVGTNGKNIPNDQKIYPIGLYQKDREIFQMAIKYTNILIARPSKIYPN